MLNNGSITTKETVTIEVEVRHFNLRLSTKEMLIVRDALMAHDESDTFAEYLAEGYTPPYNVTEGMDLSVEFTKLCTEEGLGYELP